MKASLYVKKYLGLFAALLLCGAAVAQTTVQVDVKTQRFLGSVSSLDRKVYFNIHSTSNDQEHTALYNDYNVGKGRSFWGPFSYAKGKTGAVGTYPADKTGSGEVRPVTRLIATEHPSNAFVDGIDVDQAGAWAAAYYKNFVDASGRPEFFEPMNEPFVHASDFYSGGWSSTENNRIKLQMAKLYAAIGREIHAAPELANMKVIGYASAWPSLELNDFSHWNENMKMFMDNAGDQMDAFSIHFYDGINVTGQDTKRSGSNSEAIMDLVNTYSYIKWGEVKPLAISEYGAIEKGYGDNYSDLASIQTVRSINHILFELLDRQDKMLISIPFITGKATWHLTAQNNYQPYGAVLWKPTNIGEPTVAGWEYTPRILFYDMWKDVKGDRASINSDNPDIQTQAFVDGNTIFIALNNLSENTETVDLQFVNAIADIQSINFKSLVIYEDKPQVYVDESRTQVPASLQMETGETALITITTGTAINFTKNIVRKKYYSSTYLQPISTGQAINFTFNNVQTGNGFAKLQMGIGRKHDVSKQPVVKINGVTVDVPTNWKGYDQANRDDFFGTIDIPFDPAILQTNNTVSVTFPDTGGRLSSLILVTELYAQRVAVSGVTIDPTTASVVQGDTLQLSYAIQPADAANKNVTWSSGDETIASVSDKGVLKGIAPGTTDITVTTADGQFKATAQITVTENPGGLLQNYGFEMGDFSFWDLGSPQNSEIIQTDVYEGKYAARVNAAGSIGKKIELQPNTRYSFSGYIKNFGTDKIYLGAYEDQDGKPFLGDVVVTETSYTHKELIFETGSFTSVVVYMWCPSGGAIADNFSLKLARVPIQGLTIALPQNAVVGYDSKVNVTYNPANTTEKSLTWSSSDETIATVDALGVVTGIKAGTVTITATSAIDNTLSNSITITVEDPILVASIATSPTTADIFIADTIRLSATITPDNATDKNYTWSSSDNTIAIVDDSGLVTGMAEGMATITATSHEGGKTAGTVVNVKIRHVASIAIDSPDITLQLSADGAESKTLTASVMPQNATDPSYAWSSDHSDIVSVDNSGLITAIAEGTANIIVTAADGGISDSIAVTVTSIKVTSVQLDADAFTLLEGQKKQLTATILPSNSYDQKITWHAANEAIASVDSTGMVTAIAEGITQIVATTRDGGKTASATVTVEKLITGIEDLPGAQFRVYPNPSKNGTFNIETGNRKVEILVLAVDGRQLMHKKFLQAETVNLDLSKLKKHQGLNIYILKAIFYDDTITRKLIAH